jgi:hypothetical protein
VHRILDHRPHAHEPHAVGDERALVAHRRIRQPNWRESVVPEEVQKMSGVPPIGLRLADHHRPDLRGIADDDLVAQPVQQRVKLEGVSRAFDTDRDGSWERRIELLDAVAIMHQTSLLDLARSGVEDRHLLIPRVEITTDQCHGVALHSLGPPPDERGQRGGRSHDIRMSETVPPPELLMRGRWDDPWTHRRP